MTRQIPVPEAALRTVLDHASTRAHGPEETRALDVLREALGSERTGRCPGCRSCRVAECPHWHHGGV